MLQVKVPGPRGDGRVRGRRRSCGSRQSGSSRSCASSWVSVLTPGGLTATNATGEWKPETRAALDYLRRIVDRIDVTIDSLAL